MKIAELGLVSKLDHMAYLGAELAKAEIALGTGKEYVQDTPCLRRLGCLFLLLCFRCALVFRFLGNCFSRQLKLVGFQLDSANNQYCSFNWVSK